MRTGAWIVVPLAALALYPVVAQVRPRPGLGDPHIQTVEYRADQVVLLEAAPGYQLAIGLSPDEQIQTIAVGDAGAWQVTTNRSGDHLFVKLAGNGDATNMTVTTSVRQYVFELVALQSPSPSMAYTVQFQYPKPLPSRVGVSQTNVVGRYKLSGALTLRPSLISDDGERTFVEWPKGVDLPAVYAIDSKGRETLINGLMREDRLVIDSIAPALVFRIDRKVAYARRLGPKGSSRSAQAEQTR